MKVAVVGTGVAGMLAARRLHEREGVDVTVFEARDRIGGHTATIDVEVAGHRLAVDTGFIVYNERTYPRFCALLDELGIEGVRSDMSFAARVDAEDVEYNATSLRALFAQRRNLVRPRFWRMLRDLVRFYRAAPALLDGPGDDADGPTLGEVLDAGGYSEAFVEWHLVPMVAAVWSAAPNRVRDFPARSIVRFFSNHGFLDLAGRPPWLTIPGGSRRYAERLLAPLADRVRLATPVRAVRRSATGVHVETDGRAEAFDEVVLACHADQALGLLADPTPAEREVLGALPYQRNEVVLHTDPGVMPRRRRAWAAWNVDVARGAPERGAAVRVTYWTNRLQPLGAGAPNVFVTLNRTEDVDPARVLGSFVYAHPVVDQGAVRARARHAEIDGADRIRYCGAYWRYGFHEDGVRSAEAMLERFPRAVAASA